MNERKKRNIIIGTLCGVLLLMAVGYAAFNTILTINGTASISSNWDIKITNITEGTKVGEASSAEDPTYEDLTATFSTNLVSPGDSIEYNVTVENQGNLNAQLEKININKQISSAINITYEGIEAGETLNSSDSITFTVKVEYNPSITSQPKDTTSTFKMTLDYVEEGKAGDPSASTTGTLTMGGQTVSVIDDGSDGLYEDEYEPGRYVYAGAKPNNWIKFNNEDWRIISIESNGEIKIMKEPSQMLANRAFDTNGKRTTGYCSQGSAPSNGCNVYAKTDNYISANGSYKGAVSADSEMKTYLENTYYPTISTNTDAIATNHIWYYGSTYPGYANMPSEQNLASMITEEKQYSFTSNIGLISPSDYIKANTNTAQCGTAKLHYDNRSTCKSTNWMTPPSEKYYWSLSPNGEYARSVLFVDKGGYLTSGYAYNTTIGVVPSLYLQSNISLTGQGTQGEPYTITNYLE